MHPRLHILLALASQAATTTFWPLQQPLSNVAQINPLIQSDDVCNCTGIESTTLNHTYHVCNNASLGPQLLPWALPLLSLVSNYDRFGHLQPLAFYEKWWNLTTNRWNFPEPQGFQLDLNKNAIKGNITLKIDYLVDRFGDESGRYVSAADAPFSQRALPPDALNVCREDQKDCSPQAHPWAYHVYKVIQEFNVIAGPIAPAFEQPGGGIQFYIGKEKTIKDLVDQNYLMRLKLGQVHNGPGVGGQCGKNPVNCTCERPK